MFSFYVIIFKTLVNTEIKPIWPVAYFYLARPSKTKENQYNNHFLLPSVLLKQILKKYRAKNWHLGSFPLDCLTTVIIR